MPARLSEDELIARFFAPLAGPAGLGLEGRRRADHAAARLRSRGDGGCAWSPACISSPTIRAGAIARKALRVNLSDLAAKGAATARVPAFAGPAPGLDRRLAGGLRRGPRRRRARLWLPADRRRYRQDAGAADDFDHGARGSGFGPDGRSNAAFAPATGIYVSGTIGDAALGLRLRLGQGPDLAGGASARTCSIATCCRARASPWRAAMAAHAPWRHGCLRRPRRRSRAKCCA